MSKKHFVALADHLRAERGRFAEGAFNLMVLTLADFLASQNHNFKRGRWLDYVAGHCGPNGGKVKGA